MNKANNISLLILMTLVSTSLATMAQKRVTSKSSTEIVSNNSAHIGRITRDSIIAITGTTYSFTVDTPEDSGLVSTNTTVKQLLSAIRSKDGSAQQYLVTDKGGVKKETGELITGDRLVVTSQDGKTKKKYSIAATPMALSGRLRLEKKRIDSSNQLRSDIIFYCRTKNSQCHC